MVSRMSWLASGRQFRLREPSVTRSAAGDLQLSPPPGRLPPPAGDRPIAARGFQQQYTTGGFLSPAAALPSPYRDKARSDLPCSGRRPCGRSERGAPPRERVLRVSVLS